MLLANETVYIHSEQNASQRAVSDYVICGLYKVKSPNLGRPLIWDTSHFSPFFWDAVRQFLSGVPTAVAVLGGGHGPPKFLPHNYSLVIHGIITPVMLLTTVCVASHCRNLRLHAYSGY